MTHATTKSVSATTTLERPCPHCEGAGTGEHEEYRSHGFDYSERTVGFVCRACEGSGFLSERADAVEDHNLGRFRADPDAARVAASRGFVAWCWDVNAWLPVTYAEARASTATGARIEWFFNNPSSTDVLAAVAAE